MPRRRQYRNSADRQRAYRLRKARQDGSPSSRTEERSDAAPAPFRVADEYGTLLEITRNPAGGPTIRLLDADGEVCAALGASPDGATVKLWSRGELTLESDTALLNVAAGRDEDGANRSSSSP